jgi:hypothetical protein
MNTMRIEDRGSLHSRKAILDLPSSIFFGAEILYCLNLGWTGAGS